MYGRNHAAGLLVAAACFIAVGCSQEPAWTKVNRKVIKEHQVTERTRADVPDTGVTPSLTPGAVTGIATLPETEIAPGVKSRMYWGKGVLACRTTLAPGAEIPRETLPSERFMVVLKGSVEQLAGGAMVPMRALEYERMTPLSGHREQNDLIYLAKGAECAVTAGPEGAEILEVYSPVRLDRLRLAGAQNLPAEVPDPDFGIAPTVTPGVVYNLHDIQFTELVPGASSRLISGRGAQLSFIRMDPGSFFAHHNHPEEQLMVVLRGAVEEIILDGTAPMQAGDLLYLPAGMVHGGTNSPKGCDALDIFWPVRPDYEEKRLAGLEAFHAVIPEDAKIELVADGAKQSPKLVYCEGPSWVNGKLYFSSMGYDDKWTGDVKGSMLIEMDPDGKYRAISRGIEYNGTFPLGKGRMAVCDTYGHKVVELDTKGRIVRVIADRCDGKRLDGPNDLCADEKGGIYFTDPQIMPKPHEQPGPSVLYARPDGTVIRVVEPGTLIKPNGLILSPDCKTLYVNSTPEDYMLAYDVASDGTLSNPRKFGKLLVTPEMREQESINPQVDGMTMDERGNVYITSIIGLQIFNPEGGFIGMIHFPLMPVNCCFGDPDGKTLYVLCNDKVYKIRTNVRGAAYTLKGLE